MLIDLNETKIRTVQHVRAVLDGTQTLEFTPASDAYARANNQPDEQTEAKDSCAVRIASFEQWLSEVPDLRCVLSSADAAKLRPGMQVRILTTSGEVEGLDGKTFTVEAVRRDSFAITLLIEDPRRFAGVQGFGIVDPDAPAVSPRTGPPITDYQQVWVFKYNVAQPMAMLRSCSCRLPTPRP